MKEFDNEESFEQTIPAKGELPEGGVMVTGTRIDGATVTNFPLDYALKHPTTNGADEAARSEVIRLFDVETYDREIRPHRNDDGSFEGITDQPPTIPRLVWMAVLHSQVNGIKARVERVIKTDREVAETHAMLRVQQAMARMRVGGHLSNRPHRAEDIN